MPSLSFVMPHWLYWAGLLLFPLVAAILVRRQLRSPPRAGPSLFIAYLFWLTAGYIGIHRFYVRSAVGFVFIPVFLFVIYCNTQIREVRDAGRPSEKLLPVGHDSGYLWRSATFTRFTDDSAGVWMEMETLGLSRQFPPVLGWVIEPIARRIGRRSAEVSVDEFRRAVAARVTRPTAIE